MWKILVIFLFVCHRRDLTFLVFLFLVLSSSFFFLSSFICLPRILGSCPKCHPKHDLFSVWAPPFSLPVGLVLPSCLKEHLKTKKERSFFASVPSIQVQVCICSVFECGDLWFASNNFYFLFLFHFLFSPVHTYIFLWHWVCRTASTSSSN